MSPNEAAARAVLLSSWSPIEAAAFMAGVDPEQWNPQAQPTTTLEVPAAETLARRYTLAAEYLVAINSAVEEKALRLNRQGRLWPDYFMEWLKTHPIIPPSPSLQAVADHLSRTPRGPGRRRGDGSFSVVDAELVQRGLAMIDAGEVASANAAAKVLAPNAHNAKNVQPESAVSRLARAIRREVRQRLGR